MASSLRSPLILRCPQPSRRYLRLVRAGRKPWPWRWLLHAGGTLFLAAVVSVATALIVVRVLGVW